MGVQNFALFVLGLLLFILMPVLPLWLIGTAFLLTAWKWWILHNGSGQPSRVLLSALGLLMLALILLDSAPVMSRETMTSFLCVASLLFILDRPHTRQVMLVHGSFYGMLIAVLVMRGQPLPLFLYFFLTVLIFFSLLIHHLPPSALLSLWPLGRNILKIALPVAAILLPVYFFFPEIRSQNPDYAVSGLSDILEPGRIARLALSDQVAFRVRFLGKKPVAENLYWRSSVLEESFGMIWRKKRAIDMKDYALRPARGTLDYQIFPEVRLGIGLPLLEQTVAIKSTSKQPAQIWWQPDLRIFQSQSELLEASAIPFDRFVARETPTTVDLKIQVSSRVQNLVNELKRKTPEQQVNALLERMRGFTYTLKPGVLSSEDPLDDFLFQKQQGFCEHFAASFATLMQMAGTPARVVVGYEGGVFIGDSEFMVVRDSDAHAWSEVYWDGRWRRIDPSSVAQSDLRRESSQVWITALPAAWFAYGLRVAAIKLREWAQDFQFLWLGLAGTLLVLVPLQIWRMQSKKSHRPLWHAAMQRFLRELEKRGMQRSRHEGMRDFLARAAARFPQEAAPLLALSQLYQDVLYGPSSEHSEAKELLKSFQDLRRQFKKLPATTEH